MDTTLQNGLFAAIGAVAGYVLQFFLGAFKDDRSRKAIAQLQFIEKQIEQLYGPLAAAIYEGRRTFADLLETLGRDYVFDEDRALSPKDHAAWIYWAENDFLPRNDFIKTLLRTKAHLIVGPELPRTYIAFLDHCNSWAILHKRWTDNQVKYSWRSKTNWPDDFELEVIKTFTDLKSEHTRLIGEYLPG